VARRTDTDESLRLNPVLNAVLSSQISTLLCLGAHSDDIEIGAGGTIRRLIQLRPKLVVHWVVLGATGDRKSEAEISGKRFLRGAEAQIETLEHRERFFPYLPDLKEYFDDLGERVAPDLVLTHRREDLHQDHRTVSELTANTFRDHLILEYEVPKYDGDLGQPNLYVHLSESLVEEKIAGIIEGFPSQRSRDWFDRETFQSLMRLRGVESRAPERYAEAFTCRKMVVR
jgi:LmbE family N-acetylglucosaminyl deacetylase